MVRADPSSGAAWTSGRAAGVRPGRAGGAARGAPGRALGGAPGRQGEGCPGGASWGGQPLSQLVVHSRVSFVHVDQRVAQFFGDDP